MPGHTFLLGFTPPTGGVLPIFSLDVELQNPHAAREDGQGGQTATNVRKYTSKRREQRAFSTDNAQLERIRLQTSRNGVPMVGSPASGAEHSTKRDECPETLGNTKPFRQCPPRVATAAADSSFPFGHLTVEGLQVR